MNGVLHLNYLRFAVSDYTFRHLLMRNVAGGRAFELFIPPIKQLFYPLGLLNVKIADGRCIRFVSCIMKSFGLQGEFENTSEQTVLL